MNIRFAISQSERGRFLHICEATIRNVGQGTKAATERACLDILSESLSQVPIDTGTLASTANYVVRRRSDVKGYRYEGIVGYAGAIGTGIIGSSAKYYGAKGRADRGTIGGVMAFNTENHVNPKTGLPASSYAPIVHEDLEMPHPRGGKAKFLEDPVREYGQANFKKVAEEYWRIAISRVMSSRLNFYGRRVEAIRPKYDWVKLRGSQLEAGRANKPPFVD